MYKIRGNDGNEYGPVPVDQVHQWIREGRANAQTLVQPEGSTEWRALGTLPEFAASLAVPAAPAATLPGAAMGTAPRMNPLALTGFIMSIVGIPTFCCCFASLPINLLALVLSVIGLMQIRSKPEMYTGKGLAIAGIILASLALLLTVGALVSNMAYNWQDIMREIKKA